MINTCLLTCDFRGRLRQLTAIVKAAQGPAPQTASPAISHDVVTCSCFSLAASRQRLSSVPSRRRRSTGPSSPANRTSGKLDLPGPVFEI
ncbi:hypothetical protein [Actinoplanes sp. NPDC089786]|uniref:hypothetical protein n=1 Tax=Actinoplanes sp. NPDC089786 TaxID=3155185 RepID=UPI00341F8A0C